jgi:hypothetical protein
MAKKLCRLSGFDGSGTSGIPVGLDLRFEPPIDVFIEARPGVGLLDRPAFGIGGQLGVRYRF